MRTRFGFVSNSSTTSFCIYGVSLPTDVATDALNSNPKLGLSLGGRYISRWDIEKAIQEAGLGNLSVFNDYDSDYMYFGLHPSNIGEDETGSQFHARVENLIKEVLPGIDIECCYEEGSYPS